MIKFNMIFVILFCIIGATMTTYSQTKLPTRAEIENKYKWNTADIFISEEAWEEEFARIKNEIPKIQQFKGKFAESAKSVYESFALADKVSAAFSKLYLYVALSRDTDLNEGKFQMMFDRIQKLGSEISAAASFMTPELISIPKDKFHQFLNDKILADYRHQLESTYKMRDHTLPADQEQLLAKLSPVFQTANNTYSILNDAELPFPNIKMNDGTEMQVSHGRYRAALFALDRNYRKDVYKATYEPYSALKGTMASLYNSRVKQRLVNSEIRKYSSPIEAALKGNDIPVDVYKNLVKSVNDNLDALHKWAKIKKTALKLDELHPYDTYVTLFPATQREYDYETACEIVLKSLKPLGDEYVKQVKFGFENRWIDVYETQGKRSGAYSNSTGAGPHPFILMNWNNTMDDMFTLTHEIGHNMHSFFSEKHQPYHYAGYSIFVAEVASITNEALLLDYLLENAKTKEEKAELLEKFLISAQMTFFRQTRFAEFEMLTHEKAQKGEILTADQLTELFAELYQKYWGPEMVTDAEEGLSWARVHHLVKYDFYVYQYATGFVAAHALAEQIKKEGAPAIKRYLDFLSSGSSDYPINVLQKAGVDMSSPKPIELTIQKIKRYTEELEKLMKS
ncbi:MAG: oligoendopeptidase F [Desulfobulbaceae bacterium]|nr:oligoendopeptidase F [Candidatus Kapabacteria bacterium]MBS3999008.1 oligoendopeptidase F [Desulfobulbaceae bacterium]